MPRYSFVLLDADNTLFDFDKAEERSLRQVLTAYGLPADAIHFEEREAAAYDHEAVQKHLAARKHAAAGGCPGSAAAFFGHEHIEKPQADTVSSTSAPAVPESQLSQWPVQIKLVAPNAPYFNGFVKYKKS